MNQESKDPYLKRCSGSDLADRFVELDKFGVPIKLNINGKSEIKSFPGSIISIIIYVMLLAYGIKQSQKVLWRENPNITTAQL